MSLPRWRRRRSRAEIDRIVNGPQIEIAPAPKPRSPALPPMTDPPPPDPSPPLDALLAGDFGDPTVGDALVAFAEWSTHHLDDCALREEIRDHARLLQVMAGHRPGRAWAFWWEELVHLVGRRRELAETGVPRIGELHAPWGRKIDEALGALLGGA